MASRTARYAASAASPAEAATAETWQLWTVRVPSTALGNRHYLQMSGSPGEAFEIEAGNQVTALVAPGTVITLVTDAVAAVEFSTVAVDVPVAEVMTALSTMAQALAQLTGIPYAAPVFDQGRGAYRVSSTGPTQATQVDRRSTLVGRRR